jgi:hypothetical protein
MKLNSIIGMIAAVLVAALAGCATTSDESFVYAGNEGVPTNIHGGA